MKYDVAIIGGGPAGMMAAIQAGQNKLSVVLLEKNKKLGIKLLATGKGRCNLTNNTEDIKKIIAEYGPNGKFLFSSFNKFGVKETIAFFEQNGLKTKTERGNRVFPLSDSALDVLNVLIKILEKNKVEIKTSRAVKKLIKKGGKIEKAILENNEEIIAENYIICVGGKSYPLTGSTGDGYEWLSKLGHTIATPSPALSPVITKEKIVKELEGLSLKNVEISLYKNNKKTDSRFGEALFTANGLSGPIILDMSKKIRENLPNARLVIDFKPALDFKQLDQRIQKDFNESKNKLFKNSLKNLLPQKLIPVIVKLSKINPDKQVNEISKEERKKLIHLLKEFALTASDLIGYDKAIITSGGVSLNEIDPKTMRSKIISNLYLAGEILDLDGPTGGYNLQVCWSTGYIAGSSINN